MKRLRTLFILVVIIQMLPPAPAYAYLDPGSGSMIVQAVLGTIAAVSVSVALLWKRLVYYIKHLFGKDSEGGPGN